MNKQQFMAMSLPYDLKGIDGNGDIAMLMALDKRGYFCTDLDLEDDEEEMHVLEGNFKLILHPLSDLTKPIEHNGEKFVPITKILEQSCFDTSKMTYKEQCSYVKGFIDPVELIVLQDALLLIECHFDIARLIEKGEAIDVNTIENPYK